MVIIAIIVEVVVVKVSLKNLELLCFLEHSIHSSFPPTYSYSVA